MKILQLCPELNQGGVERGTIELANYLSSKNIENILCSNGGSMLEELNEKTQHLTLPVHKKNIISIIKNAIALIKYIKFNSITVVHAHSRAPAWVGMLAARITGVKYVTTYHAIYSHNNIFKRAYSYPMRAGDKVAYVSEYVANHLKTEYNMDKTKLVPAYRCFEDKQFNLNNIDDNELLDIKNKYKLTEQDTILCLVGRFSKIKGQLELIRALSCIESQNWKLLLVGSGDDNITQQIIKLIDKLGLNDKIIITGAQAKPELFYAVSDICFSTRITPEAFGRVPVEAQAMEKIVIATNNGGHLETIKQGETGFLVEINNLDNWVEVIDETIKIDPELRQKMGKKAREWVEKKYTLEKMCESEISMY